MSGPGFLTLKGFVSGNDLGGRQGNSGYSRFGGRADLRKEINDIHFTASVTDNSLRDYENAPQIRDGVITAEKRINNKSNFGVGYDLGAQNVFASISGDTNVSNKPISAKAIWFQRGNAVRTEADVKLDHRQKLWGTYTFNTAANAANSTFTNLKERSGFIIEPFTVPIATAAAAYKFKHDDYIIEPQYDFHKNSAYLSVQRDSFFRNNNVKGHYAFKEETAMVEFGYQPKDEYVPLGKVFLKGKVGRRGVGPASVGFIVDKQLNL